MCALVVAICAFRGPAQCKRTSFTKPRHQEDDTVRSAGLRGQLCTAILLSSPSMPFVLICLICFWGRRICFYLGWMPLQLSVSSCKELLARLSDPGIGTVPAPIALGMGSVTASSSSLSPSSACSGKRSMSQSSAAKLKLQRRNPGKCHNKTGQASAATTPTEGDAAGLEGGLIDCDLEEDNVDPWQG